MRGHLTGETVSQEIQGHESSSTTTIGTWSIVSIRRWPQEGRSQSTRISIRDHGKCVVLSIRILVKDGNFRPILIWPMDVGVINTSDESEEDAEMGATVRVRTVGNDHKLKSKSWPRDIKLRGEDEGKASFDQCEDHGNLPVNFRLSPHAVIVG